jgi:pilin/secretion family protein with methylation motif
MCKAPTIRLIRNREAGISLLEILIAISILGLCFTALFSVFSTSLRTASRIQQSDRVVALANEKLNELEVDPDLRAGQHMFGVSDSGLRWEAVTELADQGPEISADHSIELVRIAVQVEWQSPKGPQHFGLETLKLSVPPAKGTP